MSLSDVFSKNCTPVKHDLSFGDPHSDESIKDPEALAFFHTESKFSPKQGQKIGVPRASSLYDACMRMHVIACRENKTYYRNDYISPNLSMIFDMGNVIHFLVQNTPVIFGDRRIGLWECQACGKIVHWGTPLKTNCPNCNALNSAIFYREYNFNPTKDFICSGHVDMWLEVNGSLPRVVDIKSINEESFAKLNAALAQHEYQIQTYLLASEFDPQLKNRVDLEHGYVFYICKKVSAKGMPYKMFHVRQTETSRKSILKRIEIFKNGCFNYPNQLPPCNKKCVDSAFKSYTAKYCACVSECKFFYSQGK